jgi:signal transduction histidine kinase
MKNKFNKLQKKRSLRSTLLRVTILPAIIEAIILLGVIILSAALLLAEIHREQKTIVNSLKIQVEQYLVENENILKILADTSMDLSQEQQNKLFSRARQSVPYFIAFYLLDEYGEVQAEDTSAFTLLGLDLSGEQFFTSATRTNNVFFSKPFVSLSTGKVVITGAIPIYKENHLQSVMAGELDLQLLQNAVDQVDAPQEYFTYIVDHTGTLVAHPNHTWVQERRNFADVEIVQKGLQTSDTFDLFYDKEQDKWLLGSTVTARDWLVVATVPAAIAIRPLVILMIITAIVLTFITLYLTQRQYFVRKNIVEPISTLAIRTDAIATGTYDEIPLEPPESFDELHLLYNSFAKMVDAVCERDRILEQRVSERTAQLQATNEELESFAYSVSHDLRAPLRAINGYIGFLQEDYNHLLDEEGKRYLRTVRANSARMDRLINDLLTLSHLGRQKPQRRPINLSTLFKSVADDALKFHTGREIEIRTMDCIPTEADEHLAEIMLTNLVSNAMKFTRERKQAVIEFSCFEEEGERIYYIRDNGIGFDMRYSDKIFSPFQRLQSEKEYEGTGIGLAIVKRIVQRHGGRVWIEAEPNKGTTVYFTL